MKKLLAATTAILLTSSPAYAAVNIIQNGSFESGTLPGSFTQVNAGDANIANWSVLSGSVDYIGSYWQAANGSRSVDLAGISYGTLSQIVSLVACQAYQLSFFLAANPDNDTYPRSVEVAVGGVTPAQFAFNGPSTHNSMGWIEHSLNFVAASTGDTAVSFRALNAGDFFGPALDNVSLSAVPEPATWAMMLFGFGAIGYAMRRRQNVKVSFA